MYNRSSSCKFLVDEKSSEIFAQTVLVCCALCCFLNIYIGVHTCADLDIYSAPSLKGRSVQLIGGIEFVLHQKGSQQCKILFPVFLHYDNSTAHHSERRRENERAYREDVFGGKWMVSKGKMIQITCSV